MSELRSEFFFEVAPETLKHVVIEKADDHLTVRTRLMDELHLLEEDQAEFEDVQDLAIRLDDYGLSLEIMRSHRYSFLQAAEHRRF